MDNLKERVSNDTAERFGVAVTAKQFRKLIVIYPATRNIPLRYRKTAIQEQYDDFKDFVFSLFKMSGCFGKKRYPDRKTAKQFLKKINKEKSGVNLASVYLCKHCHGYHLSSSLYAKPQSYYLDLE